MISSNRIADRLSGDESPSPSEGFRRSGESPRRPYVGRWSWCVMAMIAAMVVVHQMILQPALIQLTSDAPLINAAGRQRMLSQRLTKSALLLHGYGGTSNASLFDEIDVANNDSYRAELQSTLTEWQVAHEKLRASAQSVSSRGQLTETLERGFRELQPNFDAMSRASETLLRSTDPDARNDALTILLEHEGPFLSQMHSLVGTYEADARSHIRQLQAMGWTIVAGILVALFVTQVIIVRPAVEIIENKIASTEARYQQLIESMTDGLVIFDPSGTITYANPQFARMLGRDLDEVAGTAWIDHLAAQDHGRFAERLGRLGDRTGPLELSMRRKSGRSIEVSVSLQQRGSHTTLPDSTMVIVTDITVRKVVEQRSRELLDQLAHSDRLISMGTMAASLAHEINQPLGAISNYAEGCLNQLSKSDVTLNQLTVPLRGIVRATQRSADIIRRTREFARQRPHSIADESICDLIHEVVELCRPEARRQGITVALDLDDSIPSISVDGIQIQQVLTNLLQNAFEAMTQTPRNARRVRISSKRIMTEEVEICVSDNGSGLPAEGTDGWFEPFVTTREHGTGMGLAIARTIVELHGGTIWVEENENGGAAFRFTLPLHSSPALFGEIPSRDAEEVELGKVSSHG